MGDSMAQQTDHKLIARRLLDQFGSGPKAGLEDLLARGYVSHQEPDVRGGVSGWDLEQFTDRLEEFQGAFSQRRMEVLMQIEQGPLVATRWHMTAVHSGDYLGLEPTHREVSWTGVSIDRFEDGKIAESWVDWDKYQLLEGLGLVSQPQA
jgi:predicted ester cyclase